MTLATIKLIDEESMSLFYGNKNPVATALELRSYGQYRVQGTIEVEGLTGKDAAEEMFDLTNNPSREDEREELYGRDRSVSVGDIVTVDGVDYLCASMGWEEVA